MTAREKIRKAAEQAFADAVTGPEFEKMAAEVWAEMMAERTDMIMRADAIRREMFAEKSAITVDNRNLSQAWSHPSATSREP